MRMRKPREGKRCGNFNLCICNFLPPSSPYNQHSVPSSHKLIEFTIYFLKASRLRLWARAGSHSYKHDIPADCLRALPHSLSPDLGHLPHVSCPLPPATWHLALASGSNLLVVIKTQQTAHENFWSPGHENILNSLNFLGCLYLFSVSVNRRLETHP